MVTINLSLRDTALIVMALEEMRASRVAILNAKQITPEERQSASSQIHSLDRILNKTLDAGEPAVYDALGIRVNG